MRLNSGDAVSFTERESMRSRCWEMVVTQTEPPPVASVVGAPTVSLPVTLFVAGSIRRSWSPRVTQT